MSKTETAKSETVKEAMIRLGLTPKWIDVRTSFAYAEGKDGDCLVSVEFDAMEGTHIRWDVQGASHWVVLGGSFVKETATETLKAAFGAYMAAKAAPSPFRFWAMNGCLWRSMTANGEWATA